MMVAQASTALGGIVTARALGPHGKGIVAGVLAWPQIFAWVLLLGLGSATSLRVAESQGRALPSALGNALVYCLTIGLAGTCIGLAFLPGALAHLGSSASTTTRLAVLGISISMLSEMVAGVDLALGRVRRYNTARVVGSLTMLSISVGLVVGNAATPETVVAATIVGGFVGGAIAAWGLPWRRLTLAVRQLREDLAYGRRVFLTSLLGLVNLRLDILVMTAFLAASQIGFYTISYNAMFPLAVVTATLATLIMPAIGRARGQRQQDSSSHVSLIRRTALRYTCVTLVIAAGVAVAAPWGLPLVFGEAFRPAVSLVWILLPGFVAQGYAYMVDAGMVGMRKPWVGNAAQLSGLVITAVLLPFLLPRYGATGAAITSTLSYSASAGISVWAIGRVTRGMDIVDSSREDTEDVVEADAARALALVPSPDHLPADDVVGLRSTHTHDDSPVAGDRAEDTRDGGPTVPQRDDDKPAVATVDEKP